jgi:Domain of Unknown Function with PDB structure (DUF3857)
VVQINRTTMVLLVGMVAAAGAVRAASTEDWLPVSPDELQMTSEPNAPGAPAIYLYRQVDRDDNGPSERVYVRIKILTEEGRKFGDVEIRYVSYNEKITDIRGRTIKPDGSIVNFDGAVYDRTIVSTRNGKLLAKAFTLPAVEVGSVIEYRYRDAMAQGLVFNSRWILSQDLFTRYAKFSLVAYSGFALQYSWPSGLPPGTDRPTSERGQVRLESRNIPAFVTEDHMPPAEGLKYRVEFLYSPSDTITEDTAKFWNDFDRPVSRKVEDFLDERRAMSQALAQIVDPGDSPDTKLRKIYARTQQLRNVSFERPKSEQELKHDNEKEAHNVADVWAHGYGEQASINWLFVALARAAGFQAEPLEVPTRDVQFFNPDLKNAHQLNSSAVLVTLDGDQQFFDPGTPYTPYGLLPWYQTAVLALRLDKGGGGWVHTPVIKSDKSRIERHAVLKMDSSGSLEGTLTVTYTGLEAQWRRLDERNEDETAREEFLVNEIERAVAAGINVAVTKQPDWSSSELPLEAVFHLTIPGLGVVSKQRTLLPVGLFSGASAHTFEHSKRVHPLYYEYPSETDDDVTIELPSGWRVVSPPKDRSFDQAAIAYDLTTVSGDGSIHIARKFRLDILMVAADKYDLLRDFYRAVRSSDEQQIVLSSQAAPTAH